MNPKSKMAPAPPKENKQDQKLAASKTASSNSSTTDGTTDGGNRAQGKGGDGFKGAKEKEAALSVTVPAPFTPSTPKSTHEDEYATVHSAAATQPVVSIAKTSKTSPTRIDYSKAPLPAGWERVKHPDPSIDRFLYVDHNNKETSWHHPNSKAYKKSMKTRGNKAESVGSQDDLGGGSSQGLVHSASSTALPSAAESSHADNSGNGNSRPQTAGK